MQLEQTFSKIVIILSLSLSKTNVRLRVSATARPYRICKSPVYYYSSYIWSKIDEKTIREKNILTVKNNSHTDLRTSHAQLSQRGCQYRE